MIKYFIIIASFIFFVFIYYLTKKTPKRYNSFIKFFLFLIILLPLFLFFTIKNINTDKTYISPKFDGEKIIPGHFNEEN